MSIVNLRDLKRWTLLRWLTGALTVAGVVTTLATSEGPTEELLEEERNQEDFSVEVWSTTVVLGRDESAGQVFISFPMEMLEDHLHEMEFWFSVQVDRIEHPVSPSTSWSATMGDLDEPAFTFDVPFVQLTPVDDPDGRGTVSFHEPWQDIFFQIFDPTPIQTDPGACQVGACVPCDATKARCDVVLTLARDSVTFPRVRIEINGRLAAGTMAAE